MILTIVAACLLSTVANAQPSNHSLPLNKMTGKKLEGKDLLTLPDGILYVIDNRMIGTTREAFFKRIRFEDIKTIEKITDPAKNAVYGALASRGVIAVTTYSGERQKTAAKQNSVSGKRL